MIKNIEISTIIRKRALPIAVAMSAASFSFAQEKLNISGQVTNQNNQGVAYASVSFHHKTDSSVRDAILTDENGKYSISLPSGEYSISIEAIDYKKYITQRAFSLQSTNGNFKIQKEESATLSSTKNIEGVTIVASSNKAYKVELDKKVYDPSTDVLSKGGNLQDVLSNVPSVDVDIDGTVSMRGNSNVTFLINGKPSALLGIDSGSNALQAIPADQIERIEVITNPSSKFEASGTAGILNIILKKSKSKGFNGSVEGALGYLPMSRLNTNLSWKQGNFIWYLNGGGGQSRREHTRENNTRYFDAHNITTSTLNQTTDNRNDGKNYNLNTGFTFDITDKTSINLSGLLRHMNNEGRDSVDYEKLASLSSSYSNRLSLSNGKGTSMQGDFGIDHKFNTKGHNLSASFSIQKNENEDKNNIKETVNSAFVSRNLVDQNTTNRTLLGKIDYELPIGEVSRLEAGYRFDRNSNDYDYKVLKSTDDINFSIVDNFTSQTNYTEMFNSFYTQFKSKFNRFGYQLGLRVENTSIDISFSNPVLGNTAMSKSYTDLFPSAFLSYDIGGSNKNQLLLNYSRRIKRPRSFFLVPFNSFNLNDDRNIFEGNLDLNPEFSHQLELGYAIQKGKLTINPTLYYKKDEGETQMVTLRESPTSDVLRSKPYNIGTKEKLGIDINATADIFSWWRIMGNMDLYLYKTTGSFYDASLMDKPLSFEGNGFSGKGRLTSTFKIDKTLSIQVQGMFKGGKKTESSRNKDEYSINFGANKTLWKGNGTLSFNIQDIFNTRAMRKYSYGDSFERYGYMQFQPRTFTLSLSYRFKQGEKIDQPKRRQSHPHENNNEDEQRETM